MYNFYLELSKELREIKEVSQCHIKFSYLSFELSFEINTHYIEYSRSFNINKGNSINNVKIEKSTNQSQILSKKKNLKNKNRKEINRFLNISKKLLIEVIITEDLKGNILNSRYLLSKVNTHINQFFLSIHQAIVKNKEILPYYLPIFSFMDKKECLVKEEKLLASTCCILNGKVNIGKKSFLLYFLFWNIPDLPVIEIVEKLNNEVCFEVSTLKNKKLLFISEVANLPIDKQEEILNRWSEFNKIYIISIYHINTLYAINLLQESFYRKINNITLKFTFFSTINNKTKMSIMQIVAFYPFILNYKIEYLEQIEEEFKDLQEVITTLTKVSSLNSFISSFTDSNELRSAIQEFENFAIIEAFKKVGNSQNKIAKQLGISRGSLQYKLKKYNIVLSE